MASRTASSKLQDYVQKKKAQRVRADQLRKNRKNREPAPRPNYMNRFKETGIGTVVGDPFSKKSQSQWNNKSGEEKTTETIRDFQNSHHRHFSAPDIHLRAEPTYKRESISKESQHSLASLASDQQSQYTPYVKNLDKKLESIQQEVSYLRRDNSSLRRLIEQMSTQLQTMDSFLRKQNNPMPQLRPSKPLPPADLKKTAFKKPVLKHDFWHDESSQDDDAGDELRRIEAKISLSTQSQLKDLRERNSASKQLRKIKIEQKPEPDRESSDLYEDKVFSKHISEFSKRGSVEFNKEEEEKVSFGLRKEDAVSQIRSFAQGNSIDIFKQKMAEQLQNTENIVEERKMCPECGRKFNVSSFEKHVKHCKKVFKRKRKPFDSKEQRGAVDGNGKELGERKMGGIQWGKRGKKKSKAPEKPRAPKKKNWKTQSSALRDAMRNYTMYDKAKKDGLPPPESAPREDTRTPCPYCNRKFNEAAAERHIPKCKNIINRPKRAKSLRR